MDIQTTLKDFTVKDRDVIIWAASTKAKINPKQLNRAFNKLKLENDGLRAYAFAKEIMPTKSPQRAAELFAQWKNGNNLQALSIDILVNLCKALEVEPSYLFEE